MNTYLIYDPALNGAYTQFLLQQQYPLHGSLFAGTKDEALTDVAPYLFQIDDSFGQKIVQQPLVELQRTIFLLTDAGFQDLAAHLRQFIYQKVDGREYFFRFWDAQVLRKFLPTCSREQLKTFFEGIQSLTMADEDHPEQAIQYKQERGTLFQIKVPAETIFGKPFKAVSSPVLPQELAQPVKPGKKGRTFLS